MTTTGDAPSPDSRLDGIDYLSLLEQLQATFHASIGEVDPAAPVPACDGWTVRDLVEHLAGIHHWAGWKAHAQEAPDLGPGPFDLAPHYAAQAAELRDTLGALAPEASAHVLSHPEPLAPGPVSFWHRRQVHETLIHLHDLRASVAGHSREDLVTGISAEVWADSVDEVVTVFQPRQVGLGRMAPLRRRILFVVDDVPGAPSWVLGVPDPDRAREVVPDVTVSGSARALALLLWGRLSPDQAGVTVAGSRQELETTLAQPIVA